MIRWHLLLTLICILLFLLFPSLDLTVSRLFYDRGFSWEMHPLVRGVYTGVNILTRAFIACLLIAIAAKFLSPKLKKDWKLPSWHALLLLLFTLALGPGLLVHEVIKETIERPRPRHIVEFGGDLPYTPPLHLAATPGKSFVSGHASMGFYIGTFALLQRTRRRRRQWYAAGLAAGFGIGLVRIMQGGHFLSDVVFAGLFVLWVAILVDLLLRRLLPPQLRPHIPSE